MPNANYTVKFEESIFDVALKLYGGVENAVKLLLENETVILDINTDLEAETIVYDTDFKATNLEPLITIVPPSPNLAQIYIPNGFQSIFDVALMTDGNFQNIVSLVHASTLNNINTEVKASDRFNYTLKNTGLLEWVYNSGIVFQTKTPLEGNEGREHSSAFDRLSHT